MKLAGKYSTGYTPDVFPDQDIMHALSNKAGSMDLKNALLEFQYPFKQEELVNSGYSPEIVNIVYKAATGQLGGDE